MKQQHGYRFTHELVPCSVGSCLVYLITLSVLTFIGCGKEETKPQARPPAEVSVVKIEPRDTPVTFEYVAQTQSSHQVEIRARVNGLPRQRVYTEGSIVKAGQVLFLMDKKPFQAQVDDAAATLARQKATSTDKVVDFAGNPRESVSGFAILLMLVSRDRTDAERENIKEAKPDTIYNKVVGTRFPKNKRLV